MEEISYRKYLKNTPKRKSDNHKDHLRILCVADHVDPIVYSERIKNRFGDVDLVLGAGDLSLDYYEYIVSCLNKPLYFVFGNHNLRRYKKVLALRSSYSYLQMNPLGSIYIGDKIIYNKEKDLIIFGMGGCHNYNNGQNQYSELGMWWKLFRFWPKLMWNKLRYGRALDIFLTHSPPRKLNDKNDPTHKGFKVFRRFLKKYKPALMIHGHIHLYGCSKERRIKYHDTDIINCYDHIVIDFKEKEEAKD